MNFLSSITRSVTRRVVPQKQPGLELIPIDEIPKRRAKLDFEILKIKVSFDVTKLKMEAEEALKAFPPVPKDGYDEYFGLGLQYSDAANPIYDSVQQIADMEPSGKTIFYSTKMPEDFDRINMLGERFRFVFDTFPNLKLVRGRLLLAKSGHQLKEHVDGENDCRIHIPITTHPYALMYFDNRPYHMPADGSAYLINSSRPHHIVNFSPIDRLHLVFVI